MELLLAGSAGQLGQLVTGPVQDVEADVTLFNSVEPLVQISFPDCQAVDNGTVLVLQERYQLQHPVKKKIVESLAITLKL